MCEERPWTCKKIRSATMKVKRGEVKKRYAALMEKELQVRDAVGWE